jgi:isoleucyl-tRNA synthetase
MPAVEGRVLEFWRDARIFEKSLELRTGAPEWVFYEGPPTANGKPGIHHVESRTFKDVYPRFRTMSGYYVHRKAGWDCHGLPVELEIEREIGTKTKRDIEAFGIEEFNRRCRESVTRYIAEWERLTDRIGFWLDLSDAYFTMTPDYIESVWWAIKRLHEQGLLFEDLKSVAYCPRCGTGLSDHEVAQGYTTVTDPSVYVRFPVTSGPLSAKDAAILAWTTTPYTLFANVALAVHPQVPYVLVKTGDERLVVAEALAPKLFGEDAEIEERLTAADLEGLTYEPVFDAYPPDGKAHVVVTADFVTTEDGTGIVHIAPAFGQDDLDLGKRYGLATINPMDTEGRFVGGPHAGVFVKDADEAIITDLEAAGKLWKFVPYEHTYPLCWRCSTPLIYWARPSWYVRTTARKDELLRENEKVDWYPEHIKHGRYGDWLANNVDWALSRERYWGTPLPVWRCGSNHVTVVGSMAELSELAGRDVRKVDPHRPAIDEVTIACADCGEEARRVPEVIDAWFDSGAMPFAQWGYPYAGKEEFKKRYPADFISEAIDQTRGWFYSLMAESVLLFGENAYRNVVCLGHIVDQDGRKMSKSLGNILDPWTVLDAQGADGLRWYLLTSGSPWAARRVYPEALEDVVRRFLLTLRNTHAFFVTYANVDGVDAASLDVPSAERPPLDRWVLSQLHETVATAREGLERYDATGAGRRIDQFVDDLSNWWVRRSRRRFWDPAGTRVNDIGKRSAYATLYECLTTVARLLAPFTPFVADDLWRGLVSEVDPAAPESVHLADYPREDPTKLDPGLDEAMATIRQIVALGRAARTEAKVRTRQPLSRALVHVPGDPARLTTLLDLVAEELNVKEIAFAASEGELAGYRARPNFKALGPRLGPRVKDVAAALAHDDGTLAGELAAGRPVTLDLDGGEVVVGPEEVDLMRETREGWRLASDGATAVALDLTLTDDLRSEGLAREVIRAIQDARKEAGLDVSDRIEVTLFVADEERTAAQDGPIDRFVELITGETLATHLRVEAGPGAGEPAVELDGHRIWVAIERA